jgi:hypothetical protein
MSELYWDVISENMRFVLNAFFQSSMADYFYMAGGTALALQIGHRRSVDLDLFSPTQDIPTIRPEFENALASLQPILADSAWGKKSISFYEPKRLVRVG